MDIYRKATLLRDLVVSLRHYAEIVVTRRHVTECYFVGSWLQTDPFLVVDAVVIGDVFWVVVGQGRQLDTERVVIVTEYETFGGYDCRIRDMRPSRFGLGGYLRTIDGEGGQFYFCFPIDRLDVRGSEPQLCGIAGVCRTSDADVVQRGVEKLPSGRRVSL